MESKNLRILQPPKSDGRQTLAQDCYHVRNLLDMICANPRKGIHLQGFPRQVRSSEILDGYAVRVVPEVRSRASSDDFYIMATSRQFSGDPPDLRLDAEDVTSFVVREGRPTGRDEGNLHWSTPQLE